MSEVLRRAGPQEDTSWAGFRLKQTSVREGGAKSKHCGRHMAQAKTNGRKHVWPSGGPSKRVHLNRTAEWRLVSLEPGPDQTYRRIVPANTEAFELFHC